MALLALRFVLVAVAGYVYRHSPAHGHVAARVVAGIAVVSVLLVPFGPFLGEVGARSTHLGRLPWARFLKRDQ